MGDLSTSGLGDYVLHGLTKRPCPTQWTLPIGILRHLVLDLTEVKRLPLISLWYTHYLDFTGSP
jgi:hypothetical protein